MATFSLLVGVSCLALGLLLMVALIGWISQGDERSGVGTLGAGVAALLMMFVVVPGSLLAVLLGHIARRRIRRSAGRLTGGGRARAGLSAGYGGLLVMGALVLFTSTRAPSIQENESAAIDRMRSLNLAAVTYASTYPERGYPTRLEQYGPPIEGKVPGPEAAALVPAGSLAETKGYAFRYLASDGDGDGSMERFTLHAFPHEPGRTGVRYFYTDETFVIRQSHNGPAGAESMPLE